MKVERIINYETAFKSKYGHLFLGEDNNILNILDVPTHDNRGESINYAIKDVEYSIVDGILYIRAKRMEYYYFGQFMEDIDIWSSRSICVITNESRNQELELPIVPTEIIIKRWWRKNKKIMGIENPERWHKIKEEKEFEVALSNFIVVEKI